MSISFTVSNPNPNPSFLRSVSHSESSKPSISIFFSTPHSHSRFPPSIKCSVSRPPYSPSHIPDPSYVRIFDTTLRDGEQSPGATMTSAEKLAVARQLALLGVDIIEAGFPASSPDDLEAVRSIARVVGNRQAEDGSGHVPVICGLARCFKADIDKAWEAVKYAEKPRIHTFIATSDIHLEHKLKKSREEVVNIARSMVAYARSLGCQDIEFSPEDAGRSDKEFLYHILAEVIKAGATTLNIPDTVGYTLPFEFGKLIADIKENTPGIENAIISTHCQNDLGLSTANTIEGVLAGARQVEVTVNGIGERAGNASLEEVVMAIHCRKDLVGGLYTGIDTKHIYLASKMVSEYTGLHVQPHKAIVGANAFAHESGIHQDGMLKFKGTYEITVGYGTCVTRGEQFVASLNQFNSRYLLLLSILVGEKIDRKSINYKLYGSSSSKIFKAFNALGTIAFSFGDAMLPEIQSTVKAPAKKNMYKGVSAAYAVIVLTYWQLAFTGYWAFGSQVQPYILSSLTVPEWSIVMANIFAVIQISGCYQIYCRPTYSYIEERMQSKGGNHNTHLKNHLWRLVLTSVYMILITIIASAMPFFGDFVSICNAILWIKTQAAITALWFLVEPLAIISSGLFTGTQVEGAAPLIILYRL